MVTKSISSVTGRSPVTVAAGFLGAFIVASLATQLFRTQIASIQPGAVEPVIASPATLWAPLAERDTATISKTAASPAAAINVKPVVGSEATLWAPLSDR